MDGAQSHVYEFGDFRIDPARRLLMRRDGRRITLTPKAYDTLLYLVEHPGTVLDKDELMRAIWPHTVVEENNLTQSMSALRRALGEIRGENRFITTVPGRGYRFGAEVKKAIAVRPNLPTVANGSVHQTDNHQNRTLRLLLGAAGIAGLALAVFYFWLVNRSAVSAIPGDRKPVSSTIPARSIAVLPFKPLVAGQRDESLEMGMADTLIVRLSNLRKLTVRPFSSVRRFSGLEQDAQAAGRELGVEAVLEGQIQRWGDRMRVTARLIGSADGKQLWANQFDEQFTHIFTVQDSIAERVTSALALELTGEEQKQLAKHHTESPEAYQMYIYGRFYRNKRTEEGSRMAIEYFEAAIARDPNYALAYSGLSEGYIGLSVFGALSPKDAFPKAQAAALKALEIDDQIAESHVALAHYKAQAEHDWSGSERAYQRAIELNPSYADAYRLYAILLMESGREDAAFERINRAQEIEPISIPFNATLGFLYYWARRYDSAVEQLQKTIDLEEGHWLPRYWLAQVYAQKGLHAEALREAQKARSLSGDIGAAWVLGYVYAVSGKRSEALQEIKELLRLSKQRYVSPYDIAQIYAGLGEKDRSVEWLEKAYGDRSRGMDYLAVNPIFDRLRSDARFAALIRRLGRE